MLEWKLGGEMRKRVECHLHKGAMTQGKERDESRPTESSSV